MCENDAGGEPKGKDPPLQIAQEWGTRPRCRMRTEAAIKNSRSFPVFCGFVLAVAAAISPGTIAQVPGLQAKPKVPARPVWNAQMLPLAKVKLSSAEKQLVISWIAASDDTRAISADCDEPHACLHEEDFAAEYFDFGEGLQNGLAVRGSSELPHNSMCGVTGNCETVFFRKVEGRWKHIIGKSPADTNCADTSTCEGNPWIAGFARLETKHRGLKDLVLAGSGNPGVYGVWEFDGTRYELAKCHSLKGVPGIPEQTLPSECK